MFTDKIKTDIFECLENYVKIPIENLNLYFDILEDHKPFTSKSEDLNSIKCIY